MFMFKILHFGVVGILGVLVLVLGLIAEHKRVKNGDAFTTTDNGVHCRFVKTRHAERLGLAAAFLLLAAQIIASASSRCVCCCQEHRAKSSKARKICAVLCLILSWILAVLSFLMLVSFGVLNSSVTQNTKNGVCPVPPAGGLATGGGLGLIAAILGVLVIALAPKRRQQGLPHHGANVEMPHYATGAPNYYPSAPNHYPVK